MKVNLFGSQRALLSVKFHIFVYSVFTERLLLPIVNRINHNKRLKTVRDYKLELMVARKNRKKKQYSR